MCSTASKDRDERYITIINGYIRETNKTLKMNIPQDINLVIFLFYKMRINSQILTEDEEAMLYAMVVDHLKSKTMDFVSIYQGTEDGFGFDNFWKKCDMIEPAFVIIETTKNKVFGGYTSIGFTKNTSLGTANSDGTYTRKDENAFIYSIRNDPKYPPKIFPVLEAHEDKAILFFDEYLCCFNNSGIWLQEDCNLTGKNNGCTGRGYISRLEREGYLNGTKGHIPFTVKELELFQILHD